MTEASPSHRYLQLGALFGFLGVATGAFGAHALKDRVDAQMLTIWETGSRYCLLHAIMLVVLALTLQTTSENHPNSRQFLLKAMLGFAIGITIFSGSLWTLVLTNQRWLGAITPLGGLSLLYAWFCIMRAGNSWRQ